ncbi:MAG: HEPN domain-containing protein [Campylobacterota bacterium]|nr:HEPN domain-containing protein [Campylobacterota bacterium]
MNEQSAKEWLIKAWHNLSGAKLFYEANHYTDVTAVELHYAVEKILKSILAYENKKIPKTHELLNIYKEIQHHITFDSDKQDLLIDITEYHIEESYPAFNRKMPPRDEIKEVLEFTQELFEKVCEILDIELYEVKV